jgi:hypothetical protein
LDTVELRSRTTPPDTTRQMAAPAEPRRSGRA